MNLEKIAASFKIEGTVDRVEAMGEGFINDTFVIYTKEPSASDYLLQRKNKKIFTNVPAMMENIVKVCTHVKKKVVEKGGDPMREAMTVVPAIDGKLYLFRQLTVNCIFRMKTVNTGLFAFSSAIP